MRFFGTIEKAPLDPILGLNQAFARDGREGKVNLGVGAYKTKELKPYILDSVEKAEKKLLELHLPNEYLPIDGDPLFLSSLQELLFGKNFSEPLYATQAIGGTGALGVAARFLAREKIAKEVFLSSPTWDNHHRLFEMSGLKVRTYPYYDQEHKKLDFQGMCKEVGCMPKGSILLLQAACHNPTGYDLTAKEWEEILFLVKRQGLLPFFDIAYQGFGVNLEEDVAPVRRFAEASLEIVVTYSCSKNFGLYGERVGATFFLCRSRDEAEAVGSKVKQVIRGIYSSPPAHGARLVSLILQDPSLFHLWRKELSEMRERLVKMRKLFAKELAARLPDQSFHYIEEQKGMFSYTGLSEKGVEHLISDYGIYLTKDGRVNIAGLPSPPQLSRVVEAFVKEFSEHGAQRSL